MEPHKWVPLLASRKGPGPEIRPLLHRGKQSNTLTFKQSHQAAEAQEPQRSLESSKEQSQAPHARSPTSSTASRAQSIPTSRTRSDITHAHLPDTQKEPVKPARMQKRQRVRKAYRKCLSLAFATITFLAFESLLVWTGCEIKVPFVFGVLCLDLCVASNFVNFL